MELDDHKWEADYSYLNNETKVITKIIRNTN